MSKLAVDQAKPGCKPKGGSRKKRDDDPRGVRRHPSGVWAIRYNCGQGHVHKARIGPIKSDAIRDYHERRRKAHVDPSWCPVQARRQDEERVLAAKEREGRRITFRKFAK